ncbi:MAG: ATP-binding protein [Chitinophagales bacterium]
MDKPKSILLLESDEQSAQDIQRFLKVSAYAFAISHATDITEGLNYLKNRKPELILLDAGLAVKKEFINFRNLAERDKIPTILLSENSAADAQKQAQASGATDYLVKNKINLFHLQKAIVNALRLNEAETKLDNTFNDYMTLHESFYKMFNRLDEGVMVINAQNALRYANAKAYSILGEQGLKKHLADYMSYREVDDEEVVEFSPNKKWRITIRVSDLSWNGEKANLFVINKQAIENKSSETLLENDGFATLVNSLDEKMLLLKGDKVVFANRTALKALRLKSNELLQKNLGEVFESKLPLLPGMNLQSFLEDKQSEGVIKSKGEEREVQYSLKPLNLQDEFFQLLTFKEIEKRDEDRLPAQRSDEEILNSESVLHLASHDLREPVRTILNYVQLIADKLQKHDYAEATEYAQFAQSAAVRMEKLLTDLKAYIGLNTHRFSTGRLSMKLAVADALKSLKQRIEETGAEVSVAELPEVTADRELVEKLIAVLVDNGIKFHKKNKKPVIDIGFDKYEGKVVFCVRDNGIGIPKKYQQKVFELFERLNRVDEYPGNGLGLAIAKKIVEMHGGELWVESLPGFGSSFYFTLQAK